MAPASSPSDIANPFARDDRSILMRSVFMVELPAFRFDLSACQGFPSTSDGPHVVLETKALPIGPWSYARDLMQMPRSFHVWQALRVYWTKVQFARPAASRTMSGDREAFPAATLER